MMFSTNKSIISAFALVSDHKYAAQKGCWYCSKQRLIATECMFIWWYPPLHLQLLVSYCSWLILCTPWTWDCILHKGNCVSLLLLLQLCIWN